MKTWTSKYFYGNEISNYGLKNKRVDYATLSKAFDSVLNNDIISATSSAGFEWTCENDYYFEDLDSNIYTEEEKEEKLEELNEKKDELLDLYRDEEDEEKAEVLKSDIDNIDEIIDALDEYHYHDIFQYFIVSDSGADILKEFGEIVFYCESLDMYVWGVTHWGTSWDYVLTNIRIELDEQ